MKLTAALLACLLVTAAGAEARPVSESYVLHCSGCHGADGRGTPGLVPTLHGLSELLEDPGGRAYLARVPGVAQAPVGDAEVAELLNWVLRSFSGVEPGYQVEEIQRWRSVPLRDPAAARPSLP